ncbi:MAG: hypothetical protein ABI315_12840 [Bacteroidia bacterium]
MSTQDEFEDLIRKKMAEKQFVFSEKNWEKVEKQLDTNKRSKKIFWWSLLFIGGIISGMFIMLPVNRKYKTNLTKQQSVENTGKGNLNTKITSSKSVNLKTNADSDNKNSSENPSEIKGNIIENKLDAENKNQLNNENRNNENNTVENKIVMNTTSSASRLNKKENKTELVDQNIINSKENLNELKEKKNASSLTSSNETTKLTNSANHLNSSKKRKKVADNKILKQTNDVVSALTILKGVGTPLLGIDGLDQQIKYPIKSSKSKSQHKINATSNSGLGSSTIYSLDAGTNYEVGWNYNGIKEAKGFNPILGLGITHFYNSKWSLFIGAQYGSIAYLKTSEKKFTTKNYSFGYNYSDTIIDTKWLHYAVLPLMLQYQVNNKNSFSIGGSVSYLVNSVNTISYNKRITDPNQTNNSSTNGNKKLTNGYYANDFNQWDASLMMGYRRRLSNRFDITTIVNFGLLDIKKNLNENKRERNSGIKIIISYNIFNSK